MIIQPVPNHMRKNGALKFPANALFPIWVDPTQDIAMTNTMKSPNNNLVLVERELAPLKRLLPAGTGAINKVIIDAN